MKEFRHHNPHMECQQSINPVNLVFERYVSEVLFLVAPGGYSRYNTTFQFIHLALDAFVQSDTQMTSTLLCRMFEDQ